MSNKTAFFGKTFLFNIRIVTKNQGKRGDRWRGSKNGSSTKRGAVEGVRDGIALRIEQGRRVVPDEASLCIVYSGYYIS